jgi:hypothetical protein
VLRHTLEVVLEVILEHVRGMKTMTSLILDHVVIAYLYLGINTGEKVMILFVVITITPLTTLVILVASTWHAHLTSRVSLRLAKRPSAQFAN